MTREEAISILNRDDDSMRKGYFCINDFKAIEVLKSEESILDKIRAEIINDWQIKKFPNSPFSCGLRYAVEIIDKYRGE